MLDLSHSEVFVVECYQLEAEIIFDKNLSMSSLPPLQHIMQPGWISLWMRNNYSSHLHLSFSFFFLSAFSQYDPSCSLANGLSDQRGLRGWFSQPRVHAFRQQRGRRPGQPHHGSVLLNPRALSHMHTFRETWHGRRAWEEWRSHNSFSAIFYVIISVFQC